jgi:hypothetical protein
MRRFALIVTLAIFASFLWGTAALAHGTDLNTVWTTEVLDQGTFEWDVNLGVNNEQFTSFWSEDGRFLQNEFYSTILPNFEIGFAFNLERESGPWVMFAKYQVFDEDEDNFPVSVAVGCDNIIGTKSRTASEPIPWIVIGKEFNNFDGYVGYAHNASGVQDDSGIIGGIDYAVNEDWWVQADFYGFNDSSDSIISGGIYYDLINHFNLGVFASYDSVTENTTATVELAFMGRYDDLKADDESAEEDSEDSGSY